MLVTIGQKILTVKTVSKKLILCKGSQLVKVLITAPKKEPMVAKNKQEKYLIKIPLLILI